MFGGRSFCAYTQRPSIPRNANNPLSRLLPLDSVHSPISPLFPLDTRNLGGGSSPELRGTRPESITNTIVAHTVSKIRRHLKYFLNCRHADILECGALAPLLPPNRHRPNASSGASASIRKAGASPRTPNYAGLVLKIPKWKKCLLVQSQKSREQHEYSWLAGVSVWHATPRIRKQLKYYFNCRHADIVSRTQRPAPGALL